LARFHSGASKPAVVRGGLHAEHGTGQLVEHEPSPAWLAGQREFMAAGRIIDPQAPWRLPDVGELEAQNKESEERATATR
jgi:hypothetical protein